MNLLVENGMAVDAFVFCCVVGSSDEDVILSSFVCNDAGREAVRVSSLTVLSRVESFSSPPFSIADTAGEVGSVAAAS